MFRIAAFRAGRGYCFVRVVMSCRGKIIICIFKPANLAKIGRITVLRTCRRGSDFRKYMPCFRFRIRIPAYRTYIQDIPLFRTRCRELAFREIMSRFVCITVLITRSAKRTKMLRIAFLRTRRLYFLIYVFMPTAFR